MKKEDLKELLQLVKDKLSRDPEAGCGLCWPDLGPTTRYAVGEEDVQDLYGVGEGD